MQNALLSVTLFSLARTTPGRWFTEMFFVYINLSSSISLDTADGHKALLRSVCDAVCGCGLISTDHNSRAHCIQAGHSQGQGATLQILAAHKSGIEATQRNATKHYNSQ